MTFQIPSHRNSVNETRSRRAAWRSLVKSIPAIEKPAPKPARFVLRTPNAGYAVRLEESARQPSQITFAQAAGEINDRVSFKIWGDLCAGESIDLILESGATIYTKKASYRLIAG